LFKYIKIKVDLNMSHTKLAKGLNFI